MLAKALELRDAGTFIPLLAVDMNPEMTSRGAVAAGIYPLERYEAQRYLLRRCGYPCDGRPNVVITHMSADGLPATNDPYHWGDRTHAVAHAWIIEHWNELKDGDVVDVQHILGETEGRKQSERHAPPI